jgi:hypothetical protein
MKQLARAMCPNGVPKPVLGEDLPDLDRATRAQSWKAELLSADRMMTLKALALGERSGRKHAL